MLVASSLLLKKGTSGTPAASKQLYAWGAQNVQGLGVLFATILAADVIGEAVLPFIAGQV